MVIFTIFKGKSPNIRYKSIVVLHHSRIYWSTFMKRVGKKWIGHPVKVDILDHAENIGYVVPISVYGILQKISKTEILVRSWDSGEELSKDASNCNTDFSIVRSAITHFTPLKPFYNKGE